MVFFSQPTDVTQSRPRRAIQIDESLIAEIANGDMGALSKLYEQTKTAVYGFALSILRGKQDAEDILHDTYVKLYASAAGYQSLGKPMAWILAITRKLCLMKLRKDKREVSLPGDEWELPDPQDGITNSIANIVLKTAIETLSDKERQIVVLHAVAGLKHREIASILEIPLSTTLSTYHRALPKLKKRLKEDVPNDKQADV